MTSLFQEFRRLRRARHGSVYLELSAGVFILFLFAYGVVLFGAYSIDMDRDQRALRSGLDLALQLDDEVTPLQSDIDLIGNALALTAGLTEGDDFTLHIGVFNANATGQPGVQWRRSTGNALPRPDSKATVTSTAVLVDGESFQLRDDEKLIVVEIYRSGRGIGTLGAGLAYSAGFTVKADTVLGP